MILKPKFAFIALTFLQFSLASTAAPLTSWIEFFQPLANCYPIVTVQDLGLSPVLHHTAEGILKSLNCLESPSEIRRTLPDYGARRQVRRYGSHCMIHMIFPIFHLRGTFYLDEYSTTDELRIAHHPFSLFLIFLSKSWRNKWSHDLRYSQFCLLPLNYIVLEYNSHGVLARALQLQLECASGYKLCWELLFLPSKSRPQSFGGLLDLLKKGRRDLHGFPIQFKSSNYWVVRYEKGTIGAWNDWTAAYKYYSVAKCMAVLVFAKSLNASLAPVISMDPSNYCRTNYLVINEPAWGLWTSELILTRTDGYKLIYAEEPQDESAWHLQSLLAPLDTSTTMITASLTCLNVLVKVLVDSVANIRGISLFRTNGLPSAQPLNLLIMRQPWSFYVLVCSISTWFLTTMYTTVLQSVVVVPEVKSGDLTLQTILDRDLAVFASRVDMEEIKVQMYTASPWLKSSNQGGFPWGGKLGLEMKLAKQLRQRHFYTALEDGKHVENVSLLKLEAAQASKEVYPQIFKRNFFLGKEDVYNEPRWWYVGLMTSSDVAFSTLRWLRASGILDHWEDIRFNLSVKAKIKDMRNILSMSVYEQVAYLPPNILQSGLISEVICTFVYGVALAACSFVLEGLSQLSKLLGWLLSPA